MIWKLKYEFWDVLDLNTKFHQNLSKLDDETEMLVMYARQWISRAKMKFWSEILKFGKQMHKLKFSCQIMKKDVSIQKWSQFHEFWWKMQVQAKMGLSMSWEVWWIKSFSSLEKCVLSRSEKWWSEWKVDFWNMEVFITWKFWFVNENFPKWMLAPLFLTKTELCFHT